MKKLKNLLQYDILFYSLLLLSLLYLFININCITIKSNYNNSSKEFYGYITDYKIDDNKLTITLKAKEKILINYYFKNSKEKENYKLSYGDYIYVYGNTKLPSNNTNFNLFNYKKYLLSQKIIYIVKADNIKLVKNNKNIFYTLKRSIEGRLERCKNSKGYLKTFIFADKNDLNVESYNNYQTLGVSHLFAVSGMHVSLISLILLKIFKKLDESKKYLLISFLLLFYLFLTNFTISMIRACFQFILVFINKIFKLNIKNTNILILLFSIIILYNPYVIYNVGFIFSFSISFFIIKYNSLFKKHGIICNLFLISFVSFLVSLPIVINNFYQINMLSIIYNIFYVPYVSYILFPISLLTFIFPILDNICFFIINIFENISIILSNIHILNFSVCKIPILLVFLYYILLFIILNKMQNKNYKSIPMIIILLIIFINYKTVVLTPLITFIDVGQGDSALIRLFNKNILIDTGGKVNYNENDNYSIAENVLIKYFKSDGVKKIDYLILTHGDYDHMGESINLINNFKVGKVIFNNDDYNELESKLIKLLKKKNIKYYKNVEELNINNYRLYFLNTKIYDNENDNSNVIYTNINNTKLLLMGDAGIKKEKDILKKYNLNNIDFLKVGHHGSNTSSSKEFINSINPKYSLISVGENNRYNHPNKDVLDNLSNCKIYRTDLDGSIRIKFNNNSYKIDTCN